MKAINLIQEIKEQQDVHLRKDSSMNAITRPQQHQRRKADVMDVAVPIAIVLAIGASVWFLIVSV